MPPIVSNYKRRLSLSLDDGSALAFAIRVGPLLLLFMLLDRGYQKLLRLPESAYFQKSILFGAPDTARLVFAGVGVLMGILLVWKFRGLRTPWHGIAAGANVRWFLGILLAGLLWSFTAYPTNYHFTQEHFADRACLLALAVLSLWRPIFCVPLAPAFWAIISQLHYPLTSFPIAMAEFRPLMQILTLFSAYVILQVKPGLVRIEHFIFLTGCLIAANFWQPGFLKLKMDWISHGHLYGMHVAAFAHGWLGWLSPERISTFAGWMAKADYPLRITTLVLEVSALLFFVRPVVAKTLLLLWTLLLVGFFVCFGYFFWKWMLIQLSFLTLLNRWEEEKPRQARLFHWKAFALGIPIIAAASITFQTAGLAWYDTPLSHSYHYEVTGESGKRYTVPTRLLAPYHEEFTIAHFGYLSHAKSLVSPYGATMNREIAERLTQASSPEDASILIEEMGHQGYNADLEARFMTLLESWIAHQNQRIHSKSKFEWRHPLPFMWNFRTPQVYRRQEPIVRLFLTRKTQFYDGDTIHELENTLLATIDAKPN